ncbi:hypothetical protein H0H81_000433 [Sphagnurus paluster]|uniref:Uncharacterized protein n=1 Tax=Sphagnurus paluster TaxID=117069 RepID=A0A9P7KND2_9AGAR|nr:hypothetical protein H0H81_000433 [Sphagnurus paluster]
MSYRHYFSRWRLFRVFLIFVVVLSLLVSWIYLKSRPSYTLYNILATHEIAESSRFIRNTPENKYVLFKQLQGAGFNNQAQEILLFHHLALLTGRVYAYQPIIWRPRGSDATVPLTAFMPGITRNSISAAVFDEACSPQDTKHISLRVDHGALWDSAKQQLGGPDKCIVVDNWILNWECVSPYILPLDLLNMRSFLASPALHNLWPGFQKYLSHNFHWSDPIQAIAARTYQKLNLRGLSSVDGEPYIALHLRRGDFESHCETLASRQTGFTTWATLPSLHLSVFPPALDQNNHTSVVTHCYPSLPRIVAAIDAQVRSKPHLRTLHVLHDGAWDHPLVYAQHYRLAAILTSTAHAEAAGWVGGPMKRVTHSGQVPVHWGEADWAVAVDVELARRAEVFVGNGYSSLSTQVLALRLGADGGQLGNRLPTMKFDPRLGEIGAVGANSRRIVEVFDRIIGEPDVFDGNTTDLSEQDGGQLPKLRPSWVQQQKRFAYLLWTSGEAAGQFQLYTQELTGFICKAIQSDSSQSAFQEVMGELGNYVKDSGNPSKIASALANFNSQFSIFQQLEPPINSVVEDVHDIRQRLCNFSGIWSRFTSDSAKIHLDLEELTKPLSDTDHTTHAFPAPLSQTLRIKAVLRSTKDLLDKLAVQFAEYVAQVEHSGVAADLSATLAAEIVGIYESFRQISFAKLDSAWQGRWDALILSYFGLLENISKINLTGSQYLAGALNLLFFESVAGALTYHYELDFDDPRGDQLQKMFERLLSGFATLKTEVSVFSKEFSEVATKERNACRARLQELRKKATQVQDKITG